jgi:hypothetical protein
MTPWNDSLGIHCWPLMRASEVHFNKQHVGSISKHRHSEKNCYLLELENQELKEVGKNNAMIYFKEYELCLCCDIMFVLLYTLSVQNIKNTYSFHDID